MSPYTSARDEFTGAARAALDANENPFGHPAVGGAWARYPDPHQRDLKELLAARHGLDPAQLLVTNGSDEAIDLLVRAGCQPGRDAILTAPPTYGMYAVTAAAHDVRVRPVPLTLPGFQPDVPALLAAIDETTKLLFLTTPNNPTGNLLDAAPIEALLRGFPGLVVLDEAYHEFATTPSWTTRLAEFPNLVVLQTLSKAWGLAGLRVGVLYAAPALVALLAKLKPPYNVSGVSQELAARALADPAAAAATIARIRAERERLTTALTANSAVVEVLPSDANFLLVRLAVPARPAYEALLTRGVVVRDRSREYGCADCLRVTVGTEAENDLLLRELAAVTAALTT
ncbi:MAG: histidinol-phosphate transaminase [Hymenobacteraceae bacterium]|nr:histidinol-phosphate transaminase [Hymenobacteraceae bacterium]